MMRRMKIEVFTGSKNSGGGAAHIEHDLVYEGDTAEEIAEMIMRDENALLEYLNTGDDHGQKAFVFQGFMLLKKPILAAQITEADI